MALFKIYNRKVINLTKNVSKKSYIINREKNNM